MSKRGLHYNHHVGEHVLCFEPDPKKVKVIYPAKVMEHSVRKQTDSPHRIPVYRVHFQGWKASWDREVTEGMLLPDTSFNRELMFRIDEITRRTRRIEEVRDRIDKVLTHVQRLRDDGIVAIDAEEEDFDWSQVEGIMPPLPAPQDNRGRKDRGRKGSTDCRDESEEDEEGSHTENLEVHSSFLLPLRPLPSALLRVLEADQHRVQSDAASNAPSSSVPSIVRFLEEFLVSPPPRRPFTTSHRSQFWTEEYARADKSMRLAFEVVSSLRTLCDVLFVDELMYSRERTSIGRGLTGGRKRTQLTFAVSWAGTEAENQSAFPLLPAEVKTSGDLPSCSFPVVFLLRLLVLLPELLETMELSLCRRAIISRHVTRLMKYMENTVSWWYPFPVDSEEKEGETSTAQTVPAPASRRRKRAADVKR